MTNFTGGTGNDNFLISPGDIVGGSTINGGAGFDVLQVNGKIDFRPIVGVNISPSAFTGVEAIFFQSFAGVNDAAFRADQVLSNLPANFKVVGSSSAQDNINIHGGKDVVADISGWVFENWSTSDAVVFGGSPDNDTLIFNALASNYSISLGAGLDTLDVRASGTFRINVVTVLDFKPGEGDNLKLAALLTSPSIGVTGYTPGANPFDTGHVKLLQFGPDTLIQIDRDGSAGTGAPFNLLELADVTASTLTAANFDGFTPKVAQLNLITGTAGADTLTGTAGDDSLLGMAGNDIMRGGGGSDVIDGAAGIDTALYAGPRRAYTLDLWDGAGTISGGPEGGLDNVRSLERIQFVDGFFGVGLRDTPAQIYRLYQATLNRAPDQQGLASWVHAIETGGATLSQAASGFIDSTEFKAIYGNTTNAGFVTLLYNNVLHRAPDAQGLQNWTGALDSNALSRTEVLLGFSESNEYINTAPSAIARGLWITDSNAAVVARLYDAVLGRLPDASGVKGWTEALNTGTSLKSVISGFIDSTEFKTIYGNTTNDAFVTLLYQNVLERAPEQQGFDAWMSRLAGGMSREDVVLGFSESQEHINNTAHLVYDGVWLA